MKIEESFSNKFNNHIWETIKSVPTTTLDQKRFREDINDWKITLNNLIKSIDQSDVLNKNKNLVSTETKFNELIKLVNTTYKYNEIDYKNDLKLPVVNQIKTPVKILLNY